MLNISEFLKTDYPTPYIYKYEKNGRYIICVGTKHSFSPTDSQFIEIEKVWNTFLGDKGKKNVFVESISNFDSDIDKKKVIKLFGEMGYVNYLCKTDKVELESPEPTNKEWYEKLSEKFDKEIVFYYDCVRICYQWHNTDKSLDFIEYLRPFFEVLNNEINWNSFSFTLEHLAKIHKKIFNSKLNFNDFDFYSNCLNSNISLEKQNIINKISNFDDAGVRDVVISKKITEKYNSGYNLLIVYGLTHIAVLEPLIKDLVIGVLETNN